MLADIFIFSGAIVFYTQYPEVFEQAGHFISALLFSSFLFAWLCYDAAALCNRMQPDDYMKGVTYFYTDFMYACVCCALLGCLTGSGAQ